MEARREDIIYIVEEFAHEGYDRISPMAPEAFSSVEAADEYVRERCLSCSEDCLRSYENGEFRLRGMPAEDGRSWYDRIGDARDRSLLEIDQDSPKAFRAWFTPSPPSTRASGTGKGIISGTASPPASISTRTTGRSSSPRSTGSSSTRRS